MIDWITNFVGEWGYLGVALLMFAENLFPPIPSELIMPLAGFAAARGEINIAIAIISGTIGALLGALFWYAIGLWIGAERLARIARKHGRWLTLKPKEVDKACRWFDRHGGKAVFFGRLVPAVRTLISVPAGVARMSVARLLLYTSLGSLLWSGLLAWAGYALESEYRQVAHWVDPISTGVVIVLVLIYLYRVATFRRAVPKEGKP